MQLRSEQLAAQLARGIAPCYLVSGDEPLLVQEAADAIRSAARAAGCDERERIEIEDKDDWQTLLQSSGSLSLFSARRLIEVHLPSGKPGAEGSKALLDYLSHASDDILLLISGKIDKQSQRSKWFTALDQRGVVMQLWPIKAAELPGWIGQRLQAIGLRADREAIQLLADRVEGNLLAAAQEVEKLRLLVGEGAVDATTIRDVVLDSARYNPFDLMDTALAGNTAHALRTARGLREEGSAAPQLLWVIHREVRLLGQLLEQCQQGVAVDRALQQAGVWRNRQRAVQAGLRRHNRHSIAALERLCLATDGAAKGFAPGDAWVYLDQLLVGIAMGAEAMTLNRQRGTA